MNLALKIMACVYTGAGIFAGAYGGSWAWSVALVTCAIACASLARGFKHS